MIIHAYVCSIVFLKFAYMYAFVFHGPWIL